MLLDKLLGVLHEALHEERYHFKHCVPEVANFLRIGYRNFVVELTVAIVNLHDYGFNGTAIFVLGFNNLLTPR
jgi:hypothetical protein